MPSSVETFQISVEAAEVYDSKFVPALFGEWAPHLVDLADVREGQAVLDVACGTGVVTRAAADRVTDRGKVVGVDLNEAMLTVARRRRPDIEWRRGDATQLPFADASFDVVLCQAGLMFFPDVEQALREMARVVTDEGTVAVQVFSSLESQPGYRPFIEAAARHAGQSAIELLGTYWRLGDLNELGALFEAAGLEVTATRTRLGTARFDSLDEMVRTEVAASPLIERISDEVFTRIIEDSHRVLQRFETEEGTAEIPIEGHLVAGQNR